MFDACEDDCSLFDWLGVATACSSMSFFSALDGSVVTVSPEVCASVGDASPLAHLREVRDHCEEARRAGTVEVINVRCFATKDVGCEETLRRAARRRRYL